MPRGVPLTRTHGGQIRRKKKHNYYYAVLGKSTSTKKQKKGDEDSASIPITFACGIYDGGVQKQLNRRTRVALSLWK